jgi:Rps23 Pro-64 3,4-dihydroxylase Tpa1-like proline 4-hydroxylase
MTAPPICLFRHSSHTNPEPSFAYFMLFNCVLFLHALQLSSGALIVMARARVSYYLKLVVFQPIGLWPVKPSSIKTTVLVFMLMLQDWLNQEYVQEKKIKELNKKFKSNKPFPYLELKNFLKDEKVAAISKALSQEPFFEKESDLFKMKQTNDFVSTGNVILKQFRDFLASKELISFMEKITGSKLKFGVVDCGGSFYQDTDFLLPHDDQLEGREIAYIYYLSTLTAKDGGALEFLASKNKKATKVVKRLYPSFNTFKLFKVSPVSFHQVEEIVSDQQRISINGWFHG